MIRPPLRLIAVCLALVGQVVGTFGLPAVRGAAPEHDAACGCCPADRAAGRCCCTHGPDTSCCSKQGEELAPCCRGKKGHSTDITWILPSLRSKCLGPQDTVPGSVIPVSMPPEATAPWTVTADEAGIVPAVGFAFTSQSHIPDVPPPRVG